MDYTIHGVVESQTQLSDFHFHDGAQKEAINHTLMMEAKSFLH